MRRFLIYAVAVVFAAALLSRMCAYTVRFTEAAILTTFGKADQDTGAKKKPGLYFKWPQPIQSVTKYDTRARYVESRMEQLQTADDRLLVVQAYCTWKVDDPLKFFQRYSSAGERAADHYAKATEELQSNLRSAMGELSRYRMDELFTVRGEDSKLSELESRMVAVLGPTLLEQSGRKMVDVGISRIQLPEATTAEVFNTMRADRSRLIQELQGRGTAEAQRIKSEADKNAERIRAFARAYADEIRRQGDEEATQYVRQMGENPELAIFLKNMEFIRELLAIRATLFFDTQMPGFKALSPGALRDAEQGKMPGVGGIVGTETPESTADAEKPKDDPRAAAPPPGGGGR